MRPPRRSPGGRTNRKLGARTEAEAQRGATVMPWLWGGIGSLVIAAFVAWLVLSPAERHAREPPAAAPATNPVTQHN